MDAVTIEIQFADDSGTRAVYDLNFLPDLLERQFSKQFLPLFRNNLRRSLTAIKDKVAPYPEPDPAHDGDPTWRRYYPGGERMHGDHIRDNWDVIVGEEDTPGALDRQMLVGGLVNYHPGARPYILGASGAGSHLIEPHYENPALGRMPKVLRLRGIGYAAAVASSPPPGDTALQERLFNAVTAAGGMSFNDAIQRAFVRNAGVSESL